MDIKELLKEMSNKIDTAFASFGNKGNAENVAKAITDSVSNVLTEMNASNATAVNDAVTAAVNAAISGETLTNAVNAAVNTAKEGIMTEVKNHVAESLKNVVDEKKFNELMNSLTEKFGTFNHNRGGNKGGENPSNESTHPGVTIDLS